MPRKIIEKWTPSKKQIDNNRALRLFSGIIKKQHLWRPERKSVARGVAIGWLAACLPMPGQTFVAVPAAIALRANLPVTIMMVLSTNPLTLPPLIYLAFVIGDLFIHSDVEVHLEWSMDGLEKLIAVSWEPIGVGLLIIAILGSIIGYFSVHYMWKKIVNHKKKSRRKTKKLL